MSGEELAFFVRLERLALLQDERHYRHMTARGTRLKSLQFQMDRRFACLLGGLLASSALLALAGAWWLSGCALLSLPAAICLRFGWRVLAHRCLQQRCANTRRRIHARTRLLEQIERATTGMRPSADNDPATSALSCASAPRNQ